MGQCSIDTMKLNVLENKKGHLIFEVEGIDHTLANALKDELYNDKSVTVATYAIDHPLRPVPKFVLEADDAMKALADASKRLQKKNKDFQALAAKI